MSTFASQQNATDKSPLLSNSPNAGLLSQRKYAFGLPKSSLTSGYEGKTRLQAKLTIGASNDPLEQEADRVADQVLAAPAHSAVSGAAPSIQRFTGQSTGDAGTAPASVDRVLSGSGRPLDPALQQDMGQRFGHDFSRVRVHADAASEQSARDVNALAYTVGNDIVFGARQFSPGTHEGRRLIAHELTHVLQQEDDWGVRRYSGTIMREAEASETCGPCRSDWRTIVDPDHDRALTMLDTAISKLAKYDGTSPADVKSALERRFKASSSAFASWINLNLRFLRLLAPLAGYKCQKSDCGLCNVPNRPAWAAWCVPLTDIRVCDPVYFGLSDRTRSTKLIHEWVHKYGCNFDFGYCSGSNCPGGTTRSLFNADPWAELVLDIS